ncbi:MAG TPA: cytochrome c oxidase subunit 3 [Rhizobiaceae bacterium]|nr:cytochrome c oxidase subunit 3 [Rhizobiaceae bacterium]
MNGAASSGRLPGNPMMWVLIASEMAVFGAGLAGYAGARILDFETFRQSQALLDWRAGALNTAVLVASGLAAALAVTARKHGQTTSARLWLALAGSLGMIFMAVKIAEYAAKAAAGIDIDTNDFFTLYYLLTGFHLAHVIFGLVLLAIAAIWTDVETMETCVAYWHMVDLVWLLIFPVLYLAP